MNKIVQVQDEAIAEDIMQHTMPFTRSPGVKAMLHELHVDGVHIGFVATELFGAIMGPHLFVYQPYRTSKWLSGVTDIFNNVYTPLLGAMGAKKLITCCDTTDASTANCLRIFGFTLHDVTIAEYDI